MASTSAVSMAIPAIFSPLTPRKLAVARSLPPLLPSTRQSGRRGLVVRASASGSSMREKATAGITAAALAAVLVVPEIAEAAQPGISPSLKNFLLSIVSGGVVIGAIVGAVIGVSNFDPVKRS